MVFDIDFIDLFYEYEESGNTSANLGNTQSKYPGGHPILHRGWKLNSNKSVGKYKGNWTQRGLLIFHRGAEEKFSEYLPNFIDTIWDKL